jgi:phosphate:Na+ symporter
MDAFKMILEAVAGLVLFLYGVSRLSESLQSLAGDRMKKMLAAFTKNPLAGVATGTVATALLDSSSVTIVMVIALVNAGLLSFVQSLGVIMGANIGTTLSSQIIAFRLNEYASILLVAGFLMHFAGRGKKLKDAGLVILGIGLIFYGLEVIGRAAEPLKSYPPFRNWMTGLTNPWWGVLAGAAFTVVIQSSSATLGIIISLASQGLVPLPAGVAIMLGAEIGTCADTLVAAIGRSREAIRAGIFHLLFNIITVFIGVSLAEQLAGAAMQLAPEGDVARQIANAHMMFNVGGVLLFLPFTPLFARGLFWLVPDRAAQPGLSAA